jgi:hypothetical protein
MILREQIETVVASVHFGTATAAKRGRNPKWPYVPIIDRSEDRVRQSTEQLQGFAFETREEAILFAERTMARRREMLAYHLAQPRYRLLREQYGLPGNI